MNNDMKLYYDYTVSPLGRLFYRTICSQLEDIKGKKVLDFGSGFGFTANFLAQNNDLTATEIDADMIAAAKNEHNYTQIHGGISSLCNIPDQSFDLVVCHLVLEFVDHPADIIQKLLRVLKVGGTLSVVKHNKNGRIIQAIVQDYDLGDAQKLLGGGHSHSSAFGDIKYYPNSRLVQWADGALELTATLGARVLASLHNPDTQAQENWVEDMFATEQQLLKNEEFIKIAYFNHLLLKKL